MGREIKSCVIVHYDEYGEISYFVNGKEVAVFIVDEHAPGDRVYEWLPRTSKKDIKKVMGNDKIGSSQDERHEAIANVIRSHAAGKRHLEPVED